MDEPRTSITCDEYQDWTIEPSIYPGAGTGSDIELTYLALGLASEAGEVAGNIKKLVRDGKYDPGNLAKELGDVAFYLARLADSVGYSLSDILLINYNKLNSRLVRGVIGGSGDNR
jgi:NTP pyrophosphatase (non-canonical NTP hydrolase)